MSSIATSRGVSDRGMFDLQFVNDRYLPFEGAGAVSEREIVLDPASNQFDLATVSDVVIHLEYTALAGGTALAGAARDALDATLPGTGARMFVLETEFSGEWYRFLHPDDGTDQVLSFDVGVDQLPFAMRRLARTKTLNVARVDLIVDSAHGGALDLRVSRPGAAMGPDVPMPNDPTFGGLQHAGVGFPPGSTLLGQWQLQLKRDTDADFRSLPANLISHAYLLVQFSAT